MNAPPVPRTPLGLREWGTADLPGLALTDSDRRLAKALGEGDRLVVAEMRDGVRLQATSWVGVVRFDAIEIHVVPKLVGGNLGVLRMIDYASGLSALSRLDAVRELAIDKKANLVDLLGLLLAEACQILVRAGVLSDYITREETLTTMRGRLRIADQVRRRFGQIDRLECRFDELETDIVENRLLAAGLSVARQVCWDGEVRRKAARYHTVFDEVCDTSAFDPEAAELDLTYNRRNEHYRTAHDLAWLFVRTLAVRDLYAPGSGGSFAFMLDMNVLFEQFVTRLLEDAFAGTGVTVRAQRPDRSIVIDEATNRAYAAIIPDILLEYTDAAGRRRLPIDAKYKLYDEGKLNPADVYQTFFYAYAYARPADREADDVRAFIVYPSNEARAGARLRVQQESGITTGRISAIGIDVQQALGYIDTGQVPALPELKPLRGFVRSAPGLRLAGAA